MSAMLQECNYALPYISICCCLPKWQQYAAMTCCFNALKCLEPTSTARYSGLRTVQIMDRLVS